MARKKMRDAAKLLAGLGAAYVASDYIRPGVQREDVNPEDAAADARATRERIERARALQAPVVSRVRIPGPDEQFVPEDTSLSRVRVPLSGLEKYAEPMKKGGTVKGWGKARGARKAKVY